MEDLSQEETIRRRLGRVRAQYAAVLAEISARGSTADLIRARKEVELRLGTLEKLGREPTEEEWQSLQEEH